MARGFLPLALFLTVGAAIWITLVTLRRPYLRRMGVRHFTRRPAETMLIVAGSILGTALITGSFITSDSLVESLTRQVYVTLGEVDEQVQLTNGADHRADRSIDELRSQPDIDGAVLLETATGSTRSPGSSRTEPRTSVYALDVAELDNFGSTAQSVGGPSLGPDEAIVTADLADRLGLRAGGEVELLAFGSKRTFRVARVADGDGFASYRDGTNVFVAPKTLTDMASGLPVSGPTKEMWVSNRGDARAGVDLTYAVSGTIESVLGSDGVEVVQLKRMGVDRATTGANTISSLFLVVGSFAVIAGILLLVNLFVMLAAERQSELGMLRAVGMKRSDLVRGFVLEGSLYGGAAALAGGIVGIAVGWAIVAIASGIFQSESVIGPSLSINLVLVPVSIVAGILTGFAISFVTVFLTSVRVSRVNIISAIRELDTSRSRRPRPRTLVLGVIAVAVGTLITANGVISQEAYTAQLGPCLVAAGMLPLLSRVLPRRAALSFVGLGLLAWIILVPILIRDILGNADGAFVFVLYGLIATFAAVILISQNQNVLSAVVARLARSSPRRGLAARLATTYPVARPFRTAMTLVMYALIVFTLVMITTIGYVNSLNSKSIAERESSGYDVLVQTNPGTPATQRDMQNLPGVDEALGIETSPVQLRDPVENTESFQQVHGVDNDFLAMTSYKVTEWDPAYPDGESALRAVATDPSVVVVDESLKGEQNGPPSDMRIAIGSVLEMTDPVGGKTEKRRVIGYSDSRLAVPGAFIQSAALERQFKAGGKSTWLVRVAPGTGTATLVDRVDSELTRFGAKAQDMRQVVEEVLSINQRFFSLLQGYLALGLLIGIVGLGVIMVRAVRERRRAIGILRALGFAASTVRRAFVGEAGLVAVEGIVLGVALGLITARNLLTSSIAEGFDVPFAVPWATIFVLGAVALGFSLLVAALPARAASKIRPAIALRIAD